MKMILNSCNMVDKQLALLLNILLCALVVDVSWQVLTRFVLTQPSSVTEELARFLLIWIGLLGAVHAYRQGMHLGIDLLTNKMSPKNHRIANYFIHTCCIVFAIAVLIIGGGNLMLLTWELKQSSASMGIPMAVVYAVLPLSGGLMLLYGVEFLLRKAPDTHADSNALC